MLVIMLDLEKRIRRTEEEEEEMKKKVPTGIEYRSRNRTAPNVEAAMSKKERRFSSEDQNLEGVAGKRQGRKEREG